MSALPSVAQQNVFGCPVQASNSVFYARIDSLPTLAQSATYTANMTTVALTWDTGTGVSASNSLAPTFNAQFNYTPAYNGVWRYPAYYDVDRQGGSLGGNDGADHHTIVVDADTCTIWETYHVYVNPSDGTVETGNTCNGSPCNAQSGWKYDPNSSALPTQGTTDAAGLPLLPLIWRAHEILDGVLQHPVRFTLTRPYIQTGHPLWPASGTNGWGTASTPPYGTRFRLKASAAISLTGLTAQQQIYANTIITALQRYGMVLADVGSNMNVAVDDEMQQEPDLMAALNKVGGQIKSGQLEAVDLSSLQPASNSSAVSNTIPSTPNTVGTPYTFLNIQAGTSFPLTSWVNGPAAGTAVSWQVASGAIGTITANGIYTPPATVSGLAKGVLLATSVADPTATTTVYVRVLPAGPIRIAGGTQTSTITDKLKQVWQPNIFFKGGDTVFGSSYPNWPATSDPTQTAELPVYQTYAHTYGADLVTKLVVPNGNYNVHLMFGQPQGTCPFPATWHNHVSLEIQNEILVRDFDFGAQISYACAVPVDVNLTAVVTNNMLEIALRNTEPDGAAQSTTPMINGIEIIQTDAATPTAPQVFVTPGALTFGAQVINSTASAQTITLVNPGGAPLNISNLSLTGGSASDFAVTSNGCGSVLAAGGSCNLSVVFTPSASGSRTASLAMTTNAASSPQVALSGTGGTPQAALSAGAVSFVNQSVGTKSAAVAVTVSNTGSAPLTITAMSLTGPNANGFQFVSNNCSSSIAVGSSCSLTVTFSPQGYGLRSAALNLTSNAGSTQSLALSGKGTSLSFPVIWRPSEGNWYLLSKPYATVITQGQSGDIPARGDFDGDGKPDYAVWRPSNGTWYVIPSSTGTAYTVPLGSQGDVPVPADYDGDGKTDFAVWRPSTGTWYVIPSSTGVLSTNQWGLTGDVPVPGDYDGDGKADYAFWRPSEGNWYVIPTTTGTAYTTQLGASGDIPTPGDYNGDGKTDYAIWRPATNTWMVIPSGTGTSYTFQSGTSGDIPVPGDYDGDGKTDFATFRPSNGNWYITQSSNGASSVPHWGVATDTPVASITD